MSDELKNRSDEDLGKLHGQADSKGKTSSASANNSQDGEYIPNQEEPKQQQPEGVAAKEEARKAMIGFVSIGTGMMAMRSGPHWAASQQEAELLGGAAADYIEHAFPDAEIGPGATLIGAFAMYALPRLAMQKEINAQNAASEADKEGHNANKPK